MLLRLSLRRPRLLRLLIPVQGRGQSLPAYAACLMRGGGGWSLTVSVTVLRGSSTRSVDDETAPLVEQDRDDGRARWGIRQELDEACGLVADGTARTEEKTDERSNGPHGCDCRRARPPFWGRILAPDPVHVLLVSC